MARPRALALATAIASVLAACADPRLATVHDTAGDVAAPSATIRRSIAGASSSPPSALALASVTPPPGPRTPAPAYRRPSRTPSGALACSSAPPAGDCDRCPDRPCRQVRTSRALPSGQAEWTTFCEQGDVRDEAFIACRCGGGDARQCEHAATDVVMALFALEHRFGGEVPPVGTRFRDSYGLLSVVDQEMHDWLAHVAGPVAVPRCDPPDRERAERAYQRRSHRVRATGSCAPAE